MLKETRFLALLHSSRRDVRRGTIAGMNRPVVPPRVSLGPGIAAKGVAGFRRQPQPAPPRSFTRPAAWLGLIPVLFLLAAGCTSGPCGGATFVGATLAEQEASFAPIEGREVNGQPLEDYLAERTLWIVAGIDFHAGQKPGEMAASLGAAAALTHDGYLLTATHNVSRSPINVLIPVPHPGERPSGGDLPGQPYPLDLGGQSFLAYRARVVWGGSTTGGRTDLTLLALDAPLETCFDRWAKHDDLQLGQPVVSSGWPLPESCFAEETLHEFAPRVAAGTLLRGGMASPGSAVIPIYAFFHDTPLRIGFSGGPLATLEGELLGVNVSVRDTDDGLEGVGLAPHPHWLDAMIDRDRKTRRADRLNNGAAPAQGHG